MAISLFNVDAKVVGDNLKATQVFFRRLSDLIRFANNQPAILTFAGSPEGNLTARFKDQCWDTVNDKLYFKSTPTGNTGWVVLN